MNHCLTISRILRHVNFYLNRIDHASSLWVKICDEFHLFSFFFFFLFLKHDVKLYSKILNTDISIFESTKFIEIQYPPFRELINVRNIEIIVKSRRSNVDRSKSKKVAADQGSGLFTLETRRGKGSLRRISLECKLEAKWEKRDGREILVSLGPVATPFLALLNNPFPRNVIDENSSDSSAKETLVFSTGFVSFRSEIRWVMLKVGNGHPCEIVPHRFSSASRLMVPWFSHRVLSATPHPRNDIHISKSHGLWGVPLVPRLSTSWSSTSHDLVITGWWISQLPSLELSPGCVRNIYFEIYFGNLY